MVISRLNYKKIEEGLANIQKFIGYLRGIAQLTEEEFVADIRNPATTESYLRRSLETIFDIARHILAKTYGFKELEYKKLAQGLGEKGIVSKEYVTILIKMAGYRNRMVHFYNEVTDQELFQIIKEDLGDLEKFVEEIRVFLLKYKESISLP